VAAGGFSVITSSMSAAILLAVELGLNIVAEPDSKSG
jgi:hypothetical protein